MKKLLTVASILVLFGFASLVIAQSIKDNPDYQKAVEYQKMAEDALAAGEYDKAYEYALKAEEFSKKAGEYASSMLVKYQANSLIAYLENEFSTLNKDKAQSGFADDYNQMMGDYDAAKTAYGEESYQASLDSAKKSKEGLDALLAAMEGGTAIVEATPEPEETEPPEETEAPVETEPPMVASDEVFPKYYKVKWDPKNRDCLWNIAGYSFVYNNPRKWPMLYEANKSMLRFPDNPRFIEPLQILEIPSIAGETREGTYDPGNTYPVMPKE